MKKGIIKSVQIFLVLFAYLSARGQAPVANFSFSKANYCRGESWVLENTSSDATQYLWDFCTGDLERTFSYESSYDYTGNFDDFEIISNAGSWYGFTVDRSTNSLLRFDLNESLGNSFSAPVSVAMPGGVSLNQPNAIDFVQDDSGNWFAFVLNLGSDELVRLDFGTSILDGIESGANLGGLGAITSAFGLDVVFDGTGYRGIITDRTEFIFLDFTSGISSPPDTDPVAIAGSSFLRGISLISDGTNWYGLVADQNTHEVIHLSFGTEVNSTFTSNDVDVSGLALTTYRNVDFVYNGGSYFGFAVNGTGSLVRIIFGSDPSNHGTTDVTNLGDINPIDGNNVVGFELVSDSSDWYGFGANFTGELDKFFFDNSCDISSVFSDEETPSLITSTTDGTFQIDLTAVSGNQSSSTTNSIDILNLDAPAISHTNDNVCISSLVTFTPSNTGLTTYSWDFDGDDIVDIVDGTGADQSFDYSGLGIGPYTVRLDVSDGTCENFFERVITIYPEPPVPAFTASTAEECTNTLISFTNDTDESQHMGIMMYKWDFDNDGIIDSTDPNPDFAYSTPGVKTVVLIDSIPGCSNISTTFDITINPGPTSSFFAASVCQDEAMQFNNTSENADSYFWDFGDGFTSTNENPSHIFVGPGNYNVMLTATDLDGCDDITVVEVAVSDSPQIDFDFDIPCTSADGIQFFDLTTVDNADLVSWTWFVDDVEVSTEQSPMIVFGSTGLKNVRLDVQSSNGCESSSSQNIEVLSAPTADFTINLGCQGEVSTFNDNTTSTGNPVVSWLWTVDGVNYGTQDINHVFTEAGTFDVTLEVTGQNFCPETITKSIEIIALPEVNFIVDGECDNQLISALDQSIETSDPIVARRWMLDGSNVGSGTQLVLSNLEDDTYELSLELETQAGCIINSSQILEINDAPESSFTSSRTYGIPEDRLTFTNTSTGGISYQWLLDGEVRSTDPQSEDITFDNPGSYNVSLVTQNSLGCYDTTNQEILIAFPEVDLAIGSFELVSENNIGKIFLEVQNFSNLPVELTEAQIILENTFTITEQIEEFIDVGESSLVSLNVGIPLTVSEPSYFCVNLSSQYINYPDLQPVNNEKCITIDPIIEVQDPFPNPVMDQFRLKVIVNEESTANISIINSAGKVEVVNVQSVSEGLNNFFIDMSILNPGIYFVVVDVNGSSHKKKVIKL